MRYFKIISVLVVLALFLSCLNYTSDKIEKCPKINIGMRPLEVIGLLGRPDEVTFYYNPLQFSKPVMIFHYFKLHYELDVMFVDLSPEADHFFYLSFGWRIRYKSKR